jgi:Cu+-exporting ATPase
MEHHHEHEQHPVGVLAKDPVCGMQVDPERAAGSESYRGTAYYFCCRGCLERFRADPERYLSGGAAGGRHGRPGHGSVAREPAPHGASIPLTQILPSAPGTTGATPAEYTCPMHPEVRAPAGASCPKCGMALEPVAPIVAEKVEWVCPMHPEIVRDQPGSCPICGMALEPRTIQLEEEENPEL